MYFAADVPNPGGVWGTPSPYSFVAYRLDVALPYGDVDLDGDVDIFDFLFLQAAYGTTSGATWDIGDFNFDGDVDIFDFLTLQSEYGWTEGGGAIPEPATLALLALGAAAILKQRQK